MDTGHGVLVLRCPSYEDVDKIRHFFMEACSRESTMEIGYLARYTFVPCHPVGGCNKQHLSAFIKMQQKCHNLVLWYNIIGLRNVDKKKSSSKIDKMVSLL